MNIIGIDVSRWQSVVPWADIACADVRYAWIKATHGLGADPRFSQNWTDSRGHLPRGAYHWLTDSDPVLQAEHLARALDATGDRGELHAAIDWEEPSTAHRGEELVLHVVKALRRARTLLGDSLVYTGDWYVAQYVALDRDFDRLVSRDLVDELVSFGLWHSQYPRVALADRLACASSPPTLPTAKLPYPWRSRGLLEALWQFDGDGGCTMPNGVDADFNVATPEGYGRCLRVDPDATPIPDTLPQTPTSKSSQRFRAVDAPILDWSPQTSAHTVLPDIVPLVTDEDPKS